METLLIVLACLAVLFAIVTVVAFYRGWLRLVSLAGEEKVQFVLMNKSNVNPRMEKTIPTPTVDPALAAPLPTDSKTI